MSALATFLRDELDRRKMTQVELEARSGVPDSTLSRILNNEVEEPKASLIAQIAKGLDMPFWKLMQHAGFTSENPGEPSEEALRLAGVLEARPELKMLMKDVAELTPEDRGSVQDYILLLNQRRRRPRRRKSRSPEEQK